MRIDNAKVDIWLGFKRHIFDFQGHEAWIVEPETAAPGTPWTWCMEWPTAFVPRTGVPDLVKKGFHHVHIKAFGHGNDEDQKVFAAFHEYLVGLGFAKKCGLIGLSFGGLYSCRFAAFHPEKVACIYLDAPLCNFHHFQHWELVKDEYSLKNKADLFDLPGLPINLTARLKDFPILLIYGKADTTVPPEDNCEMLLARLEVQNGSGEVKVIARNAWAHHPHGLDDTAPIQEFMTKYCC
ncbi:MAG: alpha/beta fold hydrolase [Lentisphaeria bacterium]|nr:alpha/beta fold hydrolase [Lentisphaeria bacterium]